ncbi:MAG TPA: ATP-binding protein [Acidimicrobiales bacterium]|nr:ATP-binding protein [Acidimicrobiales bacterium]
MMAKVLRASPLSVLIVLVVAAVSVVGFVLTRNNAAQQNQRLLRDQTAQGALYGTSEFDSIVSEITGLVGPVAEFNQGSLQGIVSGIAGATPTFGVDVFRRTPEGSFVAVAAAGPGSKTGQAAAGSLGATLEAAVTAKAQPGSIAPQFVPAPVTRSGNGGESTIGFASQVAGVPGEVIYFQFTINPFTAAGTLVGNKGPFELLRLELYGSSKPNPSSLIVATTRNIPLSGAISSKTLSIGTRQWLLVAQARYPLAGTFASAAPWVILGLGLFLALLLAGTVEILVRRQRYANHLVAERTGELETTLTDLRKAQDQLVRSERLTALGEMASVVGHELRNPLTAVMNALFLLRRGIGEPVPAGSAKHLDMAERETGKAATLAEDLTAFVRPRQPVMEELDLADVVNEVVEATPPPEQVELAVDASPITVRADRGQLVEVLANLVTNAYQAVPDGGSVSVRSATNGTGAVIVVEDTGPGLDEAVADRMFEPFFTTKSSGTGLGLAIVRRLVEAHGGQISIENRRPEHGARVTVRLPVNGVGQSGASQNGEEP